MVIDYGPDNDNEYDYISLSAIKACKAFKFKSKVLISNIVYLVVGKSTAAEDDCAGCKDEKPAPSHFHCFNSEKRPTFLLLHRVVSGLSR